jgi:tetratricopeptide (TPR) repeat protein
MVPVPDTISAYREPVPHGIGCERCHGPGEAHVARWKEGGIPTGGRDPTIVNPRRLPGDERIEVCFQCHLGDSKATERVATVDADLLAWRPGRRLGDAVEPFRFARSTRHDFGLSAQADRLVLSACYRESGGALECLTCHDPHVPVYDPERSADAFNRRCRGCHDRQACAGDAAARAATSPPDDCTSCHMRKARPDDQLHTVMTDHWIRRTIDDRRRPRESLEIEPILPDSFAGRTAAEQAYYRGRAEYLLSLKTGDPRRRQMWARAAAAFEEAAALGLDRADTWFFLGRVREYLGEGNGAIEAFRNAVARDPAHHDAALALATALLGRGDVAGARGLLGGILGARPDHGGALAELGRSYLAEDLDRALDLYRRSATVEPWNGELRANQAMILAQMGRFEEARATMADALALEPENAGSWEIQARILARIGRDRDAAEAAAVAGRMRAAGH